LAQRPQAVTPSVLPAAMGSIAIGGPTALGTAFEDACRNSLTGPLPAYVADHD